MERFADELLAGLHAAPGINARATTIHPTRVSRSLIGRKVDEWATHIIRYPLHARHQAADVFHIIDHANAALLGALPADRTVVTCHDLMLLHAQANDIGFHGSPIAVRRFRWTTSFLKRAALVACVSQATADDATDLLQIHPERLRVIPPGINAVFRPMSNEARAAVRSGLDPTGSRALLLNVSTGAPYKNVVATLMVMRELGARGLDPVLLRVGQPLTARETAQAREMGVLGSVRELGFVSDPELAALYAAADLLLFPSTWEGFGWPPLEALACGTPSVIASECRAVVDNMGASVLAEPAHDIRSLASAAERLVTDPQLRATLVERGRPIVQGLTWRRTVEAYATVYREIAAQARRSGPR
jgi:glycosyltransferase involved in cell wall biosynthesis